MYRPNFRRGYAEEKKNAVQEWQTGRADAPSMVALVGGALAPVRP